MEDILLDVRQHCWELFSKALDKQDEYYEADDVPGCKYCAGQLLAYLDVIKYIDSIRKDKNINNIKTYYDFNIDTKALNIVDEFMKKSFDKSEPVHEYNLFIVWKCKILQNWKFLISSTLSDGKYYEVTYNGDEGEWYLDCYAKFNNQCVVID